MTANTRQIMLKKRKKKPIESLVPRRRATLFPSGGDDKGGVRIAQCGRKNSFVTGSAKNRQIPVDPATILVIYRARSVRLLARNGQQWTGGRVV
ncbi:hypothetical protein LJR030_000201 [Rhizobium sp. LjRoot30]|uniref:hypothetical protein n=1 Tax=Rhizobium sp. LjRoot30 TaxID=3342320 RepID=UPI003ECDF63A